MKTTKSNGTEGESNNHRPQLITLQDLETFKKDLLVGISDMLKEHTSEPAKKWLRSADVRQLLGISEGTLQNLRMNGTLSSKKIGGMLFFKYDDIQKLLD